MNSTLVKSTAAYSFLAFLQPAISFFLLPVLLTYLSVEEYGIYNLMNAFSFFVGLTAGFRIFTAIHPYYYEYRYSRKRLDDFIGSILGFTVIAAILYVVLLSVIGTQLFGFIFSNDIAFFPDGLLACIAGASLNCTQPGQIFFRNDQRIFNFFIVALTVIGATVLFQVLFVIVFEWGSTGAMCGRAMGGVCVAAVAIWQLRTVIRFKCRNYYIKRALQFSIPLIPYSLVAWGVRFVDRFFIERYYALDTVGLYGLLTTIGLLLVMASDALLLSFQPYIYDLISKNTKDSTVRINRVVTVYFSILLLAASGIILIFDNINLWLGNDKFDGIVPYRAPAAVVYFVFSYFNILKSILIYYKKSSIISTIMTINGAVVLVLFFILVPLFGIKGALMANLLSFLNLGILTYILTRKYKHIPLSFRHLIMPVGFSLVLFGLQQMDFNYSVLQFGIVLTAVLIMHFRDLKNFRQFNFFM